MSHVKCFVNHLLQQLNITAEEMLRNIHNANDCTDSNDSNHVIKSNNLLEHNSSGLTVGSI